MSRWWFYLAVLGGAALTSWALSFFVSALARRVGAVDQPDAGRKQHARPVPLLGGLALWGSVLGAAIFLWNAGWLPDEHSTAGVLIAAGLGSAVLMAVGFIDDRFRLPPAAQLLGPLVAASVVLAGGVRIELVTNPLGGVFSVPWWISGWLTFVWLVGMMYTTKLLDGLDGLVSSISAVGGLIIFGVSLAWDAPSAATGVLALAFAGSCIGFLPHNLSPARLFLGEGGSVFTGFTLGLLAIVSGSKITTALLVMGVPVADAAWVIVERIRHGAKIARGDRRHLHFRLIERGWSPRQVVALLSSLSAGFGMAALVASPKGKLAALAALVVLVTWLLRWSRKPRSA
ncbi:MAG: UDP-N-acetylglucosamine:undecaprenyl-P N-acetylglucosaminyl 1-P transferase [Parcubacteria group bacterium Gr01-1014_31]|nr:MAG: UDP-N-acetylglucosamine:undecaprenyl-P N-acetylglucosaminyl 1-P transferase [Parcubacteria group bacterium Gr01-1014_31]